MRGEHVNGLEQFVKGRYLMPFAFHLGLACAAVIIDIHLESEQQLRNDRAHIAEADDADLRPSQLHLLTLVEDTAEAVEKGGLFRS